MYKARVPEVKGDENDVPDPVEYSVDSSGHDPCWDPDTGNEPADVTSSPGASISTHDPEFI